MMITNEVHGLRSHAPNADAVQVWTRQSNTSLFILVTMAHEDGKIPFSGGYMHLLILLFMLLRITKNPANVICEAM